MAHSITMNNIQGKWCARGLMKTADLPFPLQIAEMSVMVSAKNQVVAKKGG